MVNVSQVAEASGVSLATASRVLRDPSRQRTANQRRVIDVARKLGYRFDVLQENATRQILFLSFSNVLPSSSFFAPGTYMQVVNGINRVIGESGCNLLVHHVERDNAPPPCLLRGEVDGVIFHGTMNRDFCKCLGDVPYVGVQHFDPEHDCSWAKIDNENMAFQAVRHLVQNGHRKIGFVSDERDFFHSIERQKGFRAAMKHFGLPVDPAHEIVSQRPLINGELPPESASTEHENLIRSAFSSSDAPTGLYCVDIWRAIRACRVLKQMGKAVPEDVSIIGSVSSAEIGTFERNWTLLDDRFEDVCAEAARLLMQLLDKKCSDQMTVLLRPKLHIGATVKNIE